MVDKRWILRVKVRSTILELLEEGWTPCLEGGIPLYCDLPEKDEEKYPSSPTQTEELYFWEGSRCRAREQY